ncbi:MAG: tetratricopeptide repeat protein, partial [Burkholderiales bacterium]
MATLRDRLGLELTAASGEAARAYDDTVWAYVAFARDPNAHLKRALAADSAMPMALALKGYFFHLMGAPALVEPARKAHAAAQRATPGSARERAHLAALGAWCEGELERACAIFEQILAEHPRDILALKLANYLYFYLGDAANVRDSVARVLHAWDEAAPGHGHVLALHAFGLEETGDYDGAERAGRRATEINPADPWAVHSVAHVMEMQSRAAEGARWIESLAPHWDTTNFFRFHLWWHLALVHYGVERYAEALELYDARVWGEGSSENLSLCNDISLLARLELAGVDVGARWQPIAALVKEQLGAPVLAFQDAHYALALAAGGERAAAEALLEGLRAPEACGSTARVHAVAGRALCETVIAWRDRDYARVTDRLARVRAQLWRIGGSHAQRDLFTLVLIDAAMRSGQQALARE